MERSTAKLGSGWRGQNVRARHDDPRLGPYYSPACAVIRCAIELPSDARGSNWCWMPR